MLEAPLHEKGKIADPVKQLRHRTDALASEFQNATLRERQRDAQ